MTTSEQLIQLAASINLELKNRGYTMRKNGSASYIISTQEGDNFLLSYLEQVLHGWFLEPLLGARLPCEARDRHELTIRSQILHCIATLELTL